MVKSGETPPSAEACERHHNQWRSPHLTTRPGGPVTLTSTSRTIPLTLERDEWRKLSECRDTDPNLFFPVGTTGPALEQIANAKTVCQTCEVQGLCLEYAISTNQDSGVWGGTSEEERRQMRRARQRRIKEQRSA